MSFAGVLEGGAIPKGNRGQQAGGPAGIRGSERCDDIHATPTPAPIPPAAYTLQKHERKSMRSMRGKVCAGERKSMRRREKKYAQVREKVCAGERKSMRR